MIKYVPLQSNDIPSLVSIYRDYFNRYENAGWTNATAERRLKQLIIRPDHLGLMVKHDDQTIGFATGQLVQFDDGLVFELNELLVVREFQNQQYGSRLLQEMEKIAKQSGAFRIQLTAADDERHNRFYEIKNGYKIAKNNLWRTKEL